MIKRRLILLCITLVLLVLGSCTRSTELPTGTVTLTFTTGEIATRSTTPGDGNPADGGGIIFLNADDNPATPDTPDLVILIENNSTHEIVKRFLGTNTGDATASFVEATKRKYLQVKFTGLTPGEYTVYAIANTNNGNVWFSSTQNFSTITASSLNSLAFSSLSSTNRPEVDDRMPLSAKGSLTVQSTGNGSVSLELLRCVAKVTVKFKNVTGSRLFLKDLSFYISDMNPKWGYVIPPSGTDSPTLAGDFRPLEMGPVFGSGTEISVSDTELTGTYYVFPSQAQGGIYYCSASFKWKIDENEPENWDVYEEYNNGYYGDPSNPAKGLRVFDEYFEDIPALLRNQHLTIEIRIGEGSDVSFNFIVGDWEAKTESIEFN